MMASEIGVVLMSILQSCIFSCIGLCYITEPSRGAP